MADGTHECCGQSWIDGCACPPHPLDVTCEGCGGNGYAGGKNTGSGEYDDACELCYGTGTRPSKALVASTARVDAKLRELFPEWEWDQRGAIAAELARAAYTPPSSEPTP